MTDIIKVISGNADIYDALADHLDIDLVTHNTIDKLKDAIQFETHSLDSMLESGMVDADISRKIAMLAMVKGFIDTIEYLQSPQAEFDDFHNYIWQTANEMYEPIAGKTFPKEVMCTFIDLDIQTTDDLSDNDGEFDELEYTSLDDALESWEAINQRAEMEDSLR